MGKKIKPLNPQVAIKSVLTKLIKNISIIAIVLALVIVYLAYSGIRLNDLEGILQWKGTVASVALIVANIVLYELWLTNGEEDGRLENHYSTTIKLYESSSKDLDNAVMQQFIDWETRRREAVEQNRRKKEIEKLDNVIANPRIPLNQQKKAIKQRDKLKDTPIRVEMPYTTAEEFDKLRLSVRDSKPKEYKPGDTRKGINRGRRSKYTMTIVFALVSFNMLSIGFSGDWVGALIMTLLALVSIIISIVTGFSAGYKAITITDYGVYRTANEFIDKAITWSTQKKLSLYRKEPEFVFPIDALETEEYYVPTIEEAFIDPVKPMEITIE